jgi:hypothetical protein
MDIVQRRKAGERARDGQEICREKSKIKEKKEMERGESECSHDEADRTLNGQRQSHWGSAPFNG